MPFITITYPPKYPLTESEKKWLEKRANESCEVCRTFHEISCEVCSRDPRPKAICADFFSLSGCDLEANWQDAAEFEARVAVKLAKTRAYSKMGDLCTIESCCDTDMSCRECRLKHARLAVEEEMEK